VRYHCAEGHSGATPEVSQGRIGVVVFAHDFQTIRPLAERDNAKIVHWSEFDRGGHYAAVEVPERLVGDIRTFFSSKSARS
jgi:epoxide hydrolase